MSFSWKTNSWGGIVSNHPLNKVNVTNNFPTKPLTSVTISQTDAHSDLYNPPGYLMLKDMAADKSALIMQRGGYTGENPVNQPNKLSCFQQQVSSMYYCDLSKNYNSLAVAINPSG